MHLDFIKCITIVAMLSCQFSKRLHSNVCRKIFWQYNSQLEEASTHKSARTHVGNDLDL